MNNIWVKCHHIEWESDDEKLPRIIEELVLAPEWLSEEEDNFDAALSEAIDKRLEEEYRVPCHCTCFSTYDEKSSEGLDLKLLLGACHK